MKKINVVLIMVVLVIQASVRLFPQECGPGCPICTGPGNFSHPLIPPATIVIHSVWIPEHAEETAIHSFRAGIVSWMDVGVGYTYPSRKMLWSIRFQAIREDPRGWKPTLLLGTGSVQMGHADQSIYAQVTKSFSIEQVMKLRISLGMATLMPDMNELALLASFVLQVKNRWALLYAYDTRENHLGITWYPYRWLMVSGLLFEMKHPGFSVGLRLALAR